MNERTKSSRVRNLAAGAVVLAAVGVLFREWRRRAPLARSYRRAKRRRAGGSADRGPNPEREPGTDPV